ncbi:MAG: DUF4334 domain-containing protein [Pseudomonadota bacterium]
MALMTVGEAASWFDRLPPATLDDLTGSWAGADVTCDHPMDGLLRASYWRGKRFDGPDAAFPLIHDLPFWGKRALNPRFMPIRLITALPARDRLLRWVMPCVAPVFFTTRPKARLRMIRFRGRLHAAMCYDDKPIHDVFARIDAASLLGWMDFKGAPAPYFFRLTRA